MGAEQQPEHSEDVLKGGVDPAALGQTQRETLVQTKAVGASGKQLVVGIPRENHPNENRVALCPPTVKMLVANGYQVVVETNAGKYAQFRDVDYSEVGAQICYSKDELFEKAGLIAKIAPLTHEELELLQMRQLVVSAVHMAELDRRHLDVFRQKQITAIGYEFIQTASGTLPLVRIMSEIAGITSIHIAADLLGGHRGGPGLLLGGVTGVPPAEVSIIGAGTVGYHAARTAIGLGARVKIVDEDVFKLRRLEELLGVKVWTAVAQPHYVEQAVREADVVIGAAFNKGARTPCVVTEEMVMQMRAGSVIVDVSIDQGGCVETSRMTTLQNPTFVKHDITHYCVPNIASRVAQTASIAVSNILGPMVFAICEAGGVKNLLASHVGVRTGIYVYMKHVTQRHIARLFDLQYMDIELLGAVNPASM